MGPQRVGVRPGGLTFTFAGLWRSHPAVVFLRACIISVCPVNFGVGYFIFLLKMFSHILSHFIKADLQARLHVQAHCVADGKAGRGLKEPREAILCPSLKRRFSGWLL